MPSRASSSVIPGSRCPSAARSSSSRLSRLQTPSRSRLVSISAAAIAPLGGGVHVQDRAAVGVGHGAHPVRRPLGGQRAGAVAAAAQDHQRDQLRLADQRVRGGLPGHADQLDHGRVESGLRQVTQAGLDPAVIQLIRTPGPGRGPYALVRQPGADPAGDPARQRRQHPGAGRRGGPRTGSGPSRTPTAAGCSTWTRRPTRGGRAL